VDRPWKLYCLERSIGKLAHGHADRRKSAENRQLRLIEGEISDIQGAET